MDPQRRRNRLPPGEGDLPLFWLGAGASRRLPLSCQFNSYPHRREGTNMRTCTNVMSAPHSVELASLVRRYQGLVEETLELAAAGYNPAHLADARAAAVEALRLIRTFADTHAGAYRQAAASALEAGEANLA